jgi:5-oxoprolinase (ATP-hydrolysing) subunit A
MKESAVTVINCDMGEAFGLYKMGDDVGIMPLIDVANVACGFHASDFNHMRATARLAKKHGVKVGAHPSLPDLQGFGRREMKIGREELANCIIYQVGALKGFLEAEGMTLNHIKPHGSLYGMAARMEEMAHAVCDAADVFKVPLLGMINTLHETIYPARGHRFIAEFYTDLDYSDDGGLIITREHGAKDPAEAAAKSLRAIKEGKVKSTGGKDVAVRADSICIHSDTPNAVAIAQAVRGAIKPYITAA